MKRKFTKCNNCNGTLIPKKNKKTKEWSFVCENAKKNNCFEIFLNEDYQDVFNELKKWKINEFEIHDFIKIGKDPLKMLGTILFINNLHLTIYKNKLNAFATLLKSHLSLSVTTLFVTLKYKYTLIYEFVTFTLISIFLIILGFYIGNMNISYLDDYIELSKISETQDITHETTPIKEINKNKKTKFIDSDKDGISDNDELLIYHTDPLKKDTDSDGYDDKIELDNGYDPLVKNF